MKNRVTIQTIKNNMPMTTESAVLTAIYQTTKIWVTTHSDGTKLDGLQSVNTSVLVNPICQARRKCKDSICAKCYAENLCRMRHTLDAHLVENFKILTTRLLSYEEAAAVDIKTLLARIESFGDVANALQARNYLRIIATHPMTQWGIWTKNWNFYLKAFLAEGKPENCTFVLSSEKLNERAEVPEAIKPYVDHVFTVWEPEIYDAKFAGGETECAGLSCWHCRKCYTKGGSFYIDERRR